MPLPPAGPLPPGAERLSSRRRTGRRSPASTFRRTAGRRPTLILGFGGNAWNGQDVAEYLHELFPTTRSWPSITAATRHRRVAVGRGADRRRAAGLRFRRRAGEAGARRRGRLQHRQRHRRAACGQAQARRADPRHAVRFAEGGRPVDVSRGCRSARSSATRSMPPSRSRAATCRSRSSPRSATRSFRPSEPTPCASACRTSSSTGRSPAPATTTSSPSDFHAMPMREAVRPSQSCDSQCPC